MCLIDKKQFRIAKQDIPVFKVVYTYNNKTYYSPFKETRLWKINNIIETVQSGPIWLNRYIEKPDALGNYNFGENYFHAFTDKDYAENMLKTINNAVNSKLPYFHTEAIYCIVTGYIPKGTRYAIGIEGMCICARKIILNLQ